MTSSVAKAAPRPIEERSLIAVIRSDEPREPFVDLGPLFLAEVRSDREFHERLQVEADRLAADGFILEGRGLEEVYDAHYLGPFLNTRPRGLPASEEKSPVTVSWNGRSDGIAAAILIATDILIEGRLRTPKARGDRIYVRAYRLFRGRLPPPPGRIDAPVPGMMAERVASLAALSSLDEQLRFLYGLLVSGDIDLETYGRARAALCRDS